MICRFIIDGLLTRPAMAHCQSSPLSNHYRKWTVTNKESKPVLFCCMLLDQQVSYTFFCYLPKLQPLWVPLLYSKKMLQIKFLVNIQGGAISLQEKDRLDNKLGLNGTYTIKGFGFQDSRKSLQTLPHTLCLALGKYTNVHTSTSFPIMNCMQRLTTKKECLQVHRNNSCKFYFTSILNTKLNAIRLCWLCAIREWTTK